MIESSHQDMAGRELKAKISAAYAYLAERGDEMNAAKIRQLAVKLRDGEFAVAFCGHFSAGKSTMINRLIGEKLLPSSPIPTSANLVKVKAGLEYAKVFFKNGKPRVYLAPYDYEMVKNYCKDGDQIESIEISHDVSTLPPRVVILDTPGIDSADDAHRIATESAIHLADLVFYVMDYNHVQSELNFMFTKELTDAGKEIYLIVNQVDKHNDKELSFNAFKEGALEAFASWGVKPAEIFFTSLKHDGHSLNEFTRLQSFLARYLMQKDHLLILSVEQSLRKILNDHLAATHEEGKERLRSAKEMLRALSAESLAQVEQKYKKILADKQTMGEGGEAAERDFDRGIHKIMENAYLMPFSTRALAEAYLESCQPKFKVGWLFAREKTAAERVSRRDAFYHDICEKTKSQLSWHLREFLLTFVQIENEELAAKLRGFALAFPIEVVEDAVKEGAQMSGEYVLNYTASVANEIKRQAKAEIAPLKAEILRMIKAREETIKIRLEKEAAGLEQYIAALEEIKREETAKRRAKEKVMAMLETAKASEEDRFRLFAPEDDMAEVIDGQRNSSAAQEESRRETAVHETGVRRNPTAQQAPDKMQSTAGNLARAAGLIGALPGFAKLADELMAKADRLKHKGFTVALFGAFSAGKSSFANALIGERALPVSPNPTTATISRIKPVEAVNPHGTVCVKLKAEAALLEDINHALHAFGLRADDLADALRKAKKLDAKESRVIGAAKTNYAFLQAFALGYGEVCGALGTVHKTGMEDFGDYVAQEEKSCFVEWIDLYYDCPLTRKGITLVDTPGADSINARHTGVAFEFIRNADAVLFVTYYNHAFSKADREFLIQLGRVKDAFQLDKMFFVINAIDLAESEAEKSLVAEYMRGQLVKYGVRNPLLYPLSSLQALRDRASEESSGTSGMDFFEERFYHFITHDLAALAVQSSEIELDRVRLLLKKLIAGAEEDESVKQEKRARIEAEKETVTAFLAHQTAQALTERLDKEIEELAYYIRQRVFLRFNDFFRESFNPSVLCDDGRDMREALQGALRELVESIGFVFAEEMRATTVRLDRFKEKRAAQFQLKLIEHIKETNEDLSFSLNECDKAVQIAFAPAFSSIQYASFGKALTYFKQAKSFFEKGAHQRMNEEIKRTLDLEASLYLQQEQARLRAAYGDAIEEEIRAMIAHMTRQTEDFYLSLLAALDGGVTIDQLCEAERALMQMK